MGSCSRESAGRPATAARDAAGYFYLTSGSIRVCIAVAASSGVLQPDHGGLDSSWKIVSACSEASNDDGTTSALWIALASSAV